MPDRVLRAMDMPTLDHRGPEFAELGFAVLASMQRVFRTQQPVIIFPSSGTGAWEAAMVNVFAPGDKVLMCETGQFAVLWRGIADKFKLDVDFIPSDWRHGADLAEIEKRCLRRQAAHDQGGLVVHNETSTGCVTPPLEVRKALEPRQALRRCSWSTPSPSLGSIEYRHDAWEVDVTVTGSQKGLMLPPGLGFNAVSEKALAARKRSTMPRAYWDWEEMLKANESGFYPYTPATNLLYALREALLMIEEEGLANIFRRHERYGAATRACVRAWGLDILCEEPLDQSDALTAVMTPEGHDADRLRQIILENFDMSLGTGLGRWRGRCSGSATSGLQRPEADGHAERRRDGPGSRKDSAPGAAAYWRPWTS